ncbi:MAG TPA: hypothetical protein VGV38_16000 [Pyrinomonadaceae bacterium]|nr:hypothetical protein [Pyrinomonadaceae bacterium]
MGGGFAGVETVAGVNDFLREAVGFYPHLREEMLRVALDWTLDLLFTKDIVQYMSPPAPAVSRAEWRVDSDTPSRARARAEVTELVSQ